jgi:transcriptional regulator with XRE-family HTH domain
MTDLEPALGPHRLDVALGVSIRQRRKELGVSQTALAHAVGLTFQQIQKYERGFNRVSFSRLVDIAHALDCRVVDLIGDLDDGKAPEARLGKDVANLREAGASELLAAYAQTPPPLRRAILKLVLEIAKDRGVRRRGEGDAVLDA